MQSKDFSRLRNCPFCGGEAGAFCTSTNSDNGTLSKIFIIACKKCGVRSPKPFRIYANIRDDGSCTFNATEKEEAVNLWNRRYSDE